MKESNLILLPKREFVKCLTGVGITFTSLRNLLCKLPNQGKLPHETVSRLFVWEM